MTPFETALHQYRRDMRNAAIYIGLPRDQLDDCFQESSRRLGKIRIDYGNPHRVRGLFCKVMRNVALNILYVQGETNGHQNRWANHVSVLSQENSRRWEREREIINVVRLALAQLTEFDASLAWKYYALEQSQREISEDLFKERGLKWDQGRVSRYIRHKVRPLLRKRLIELGGDKL